MNTYIRISNQLNGGQHMCKCTEAMEQHGDELDNQDGSKEEQE